ncbi:MAG: LemA family protein [Patescibacteria group bacterium]
MDIFKKGWVWVIVAVLVLGIWAVSSYNSFVSLSEGADTQWAQVENQFQRRFDLVPNLVASVKGSLAQEQKVFGDIADARTRYAGAASVDDKVAAANQLEGSLARLLVIVESYPQLASQANVRALMDELAGTENRIAVERGRFNEKVQAYNIAVKRFPGVVTASLFGYKERALFKANENADTAPAVSL